MSDKTMVSMPIDEYNSLKEFENHLKEYEKILCKHMIIQFNREYENKLKELHNKWWFKMFAKKYKDNGYWNISVFPILKQAAKWAKL